MFIIQHCRVSTIGRQQGAALVTALIFLIIITAIALSAMRGSTQELRMALNAEFKASALQRAQAVSDAVVSNPTNTPVVGQIGRRVCVGDVPQGEPSCVDTATLTLPANLELDLGLSGQDRRFAAVERVAPEASLCPRGTDFSSQVNCATFRIHANFDGTAERRGRADLYEGVLVLLPAQQ